MKKFFFPLSFFFSFCNSSHRLLITPLHLIYFCEFNNDGTGFIKYGNYLNSVLFFSLFLLDKDFWCLFSSPLWFCYSSPSCYESPQQPVSRWLTDYSLSIVVQMLNHYVKGHVKGHVEAPGPLWLWKRLHFWDLFQVWNRTTFIILFSHRLTCPLHLLLVAVTWQNLEKFWWSKALKI